MPFSHADLGALFQGDGFTLWHYRTADTRAAVAADGYIAPMAGSMLPGDLVILRPPTPWRCCRCGRARRSAPDVTPDGAVGALSLVRAAAHLAR